MTNKPFPTADVLTVVTGIVMRTGGDFQAVMDHLYPGIMTIGCAAMQSRAAEIIIRQHPKLREFLRVNGPVAGDLSSVADCLSMAHVCFGPEMAIDGPVDESEIDAEAAFAEFAARSKP